MTLDARVLRYDDADRQMREDLPLYCANLVRIQDKAGTERPLILNEAQLRLHAALQAQLDSRDLVRAIVLKARRLGISTYVGARFYRRTTMWPGQNAFILTHEDKSTHELFDQAKFIHSKMPDDYRPATGAANENELYFSAHGGGYRVGTAKNITGLGRGFTLQVFHGSEVAFWPHAHRHFAGVMKAISLVRGTEMILESTANGVGGEFYNQWIKAEAGQSDFIPIFLPWFIDPDNARPLDGNFDPSPEEEQYQRLYALTDEQLCWMHYENINNCHGEPGILSPTFRQENPATAAEAFQNTGAESYIDSEYVLRARRIKVPDQKHMPRVLGVDVARGGADRTRIIDRQGRRAGRIDETMHTDDLVQVAHRVMFLLNKHPDICKAFIDITGLGSGVYDIIRNNGFEERVAGVNFGSLAQDPQRYVNRRAEMWARQKDWFLDPGNCQIPDDDEWQRHITAPGAKYDAASRLKLEKKEDIKKRLQFSPDVGDALGLTFAELLPIDAPETRAKWERDHGEEEELDFMTS